MDDLDRLIAGMNLTEEQWREASRCEECGHCWRTEDGRSDWIAQRCKHGCCIEHRCVECNHYHGGFGAAGCPCDDSDREAAQ